MAKRGFLSRGKEKTGRDSPRPVFRWPEKLSGNFATAEITVDQKADADGQGNQAERGCSESVRLRGNTRNYRKRGDVTDRAADAQNAQASRTADMGNFRLHRNSHAARNRRKAFLGPQLSNPVVREHARDKSEEHTSELQSP